MLGGALRCQEKCYGCRVSHATICYIQFMADDTEILQMPPKAKRHYSPRKPKQPEPAPIPSPQAPNPNVLAAESRINELIEQRLQAQFAMSRANQALQSAQMQFQNARDEVSRLEGEINYRQSVVNQMRGVSSAGSGYPTAPAPTAQDSFYWHGQPPVAQFQPAPAPWQQQSPSYAPASPYPQYPAPFDPRLVPQVGVGAIPAPNHGLYPDLVGGPDGSRTESAEQLRMDEMRSRGY